MTGFAWAFEGKWRNGQTPIVSKRAYVVKYDQSNWAYDITADDMPEFQEWLAQNWEEDNRPRNEDESAADYLDRIGVVIFEPA